MNPIDMKTWRCSVTLSIALLPCLLLPSSAWAYRPFVSTDAAVADIKEFEVELGYFNLERVNRRNNFVVPTVVFNYGFMHDVEVVGEFAVEEPAHGRVRLTDGGLSLKAVLKEGVLQEKDGLSFAVETGPLLPSTTNDESKFGFKGLGILSGRLASLTYHLNLGGGVDRQKSHPFVDWGVIVELPIIPDLRLVAEVNGESIKGTPAENSGLIGFIWKSPLPHLFVDAGIRRGISRAAPEWAFTTGVTVSFSLTAPADK
jgi:hypothetical protein